MAEINDPGFLENGEHSAQMMRLMMQSLIPTEGVVNKSGGDLNVTEKSGTPDMSVDVAQGSVYIEGDETSDQGFYFAYNDAVKNLTIAAADASNPRKDLIVAQVEDSEQSGGTDDWSLTVVTGTAEASPSEPTVPDNSHVLALVDVGAGVSSITNANITDRRDQCAGVGHRKVVKFTASGTFDKADYPWLRAVRVKVVGGGGGGGGVGSPAAGESAAAGGGGGGGYAEALVAVGDLAASETVTVGAGGTRGEFGTAGTAPTDGGASSFGSHAAADGGTAAFSNANPTSTLPSTGSGAGTGGDATAGDIQAWGGDGTRGLQLAPQSVEAGAGGGTALAGVTHTNSSNSNGADGHAPGGGGTGSAARAGAGSGSRGGHGADGIVIVELFG